jgi:hypothetical protein
MFVARAGFHGRLLEASVAIFSGLSDFLSCCLPSVLAASAAGVCQACKDPRFKKTASVSIRSWRRNRLNASVASESAERMIDSSEHGSSQPANPPTWLESAGNTWIIHQQACHLLYISRWNQWYLPPALAPPKGQAGMQRSRPPKCTHQAPRPTSQPPAILSSPPETRHQPCRSPPTATSQEPVRRHPPASQQPGISLPNAASTITDKPTISTPCCACMYAQVEHVRPGRTCTPR